MRQYMIVSRIYLILSVINFALAAPLVIREGHIVRVDVVDVAKDGTVASQTLSRRDPRDGRVPSPSPEPSNESGPEPSDESDPEPRPDTSSSESGSNINTPSSSESAPSGSASPGDDVPQWLHEYHNYMLHLMHSGSTDHSDSAGSVPTDYSYSTGSRPTDYSDSAGSGPIDYSYSTGSGSTDYSYSTGSESTDSYSPSTSSGSTDYSYTPSTDSGSTDYSWTDASASSSPTEHTPQSPGQTDTHPLPGPPPNPAPSTGPQGPQQSTDGLIPASPEPQSPAEQETESFLTKLLKGRIKRRTSLPYWKCGPEGVAGYS